MMKICEETKRKPNSSTKKSSIIKRKNYYLEEIHMKQYYEEPKLEIMEFILGDIITTSQEGGFEGEDEELE